ncbi:MAG: hypothetical protein R2856_12580 [Caldilineaceae bacterium]
MKTLRLFALLCTLSLGLFWTTTAQSPTDLSLLTIDDLRYEGAFRLPADEFGLSSMNYSEGPLFYHPDRESIFIVGHAHQQAIAEFAVPEIVDSTVITDLAMAAAPVQNFAAFLDSAQGDNPQLLDRIGGLAVISGTTQMLVNAYEYYDAPGDNTDTTLVIGDAADLAGAQVEGFFAFEGGAGHTSGWISPVPPAWQSILGGPYITGASSGIPIISRTSVGPSAFVFDPADVGASSPISTTKLLDFSLDHPLHEDLSNDSRENSLWTHLSRHLRRHCAGDAHLPHPGLLGWTRKRRLLQMHPGQRQRMRRLLRAPGRRLLSFLLAVGCQRSGGGEERGEAGVRSAALRIG